MTAQIEYIAILLHFSQFSLKNNKSDFERYIFVNCFINSTFAFLFSYL